jgi:hypothetical protein
MQALRTNSETQFNKGLGQVVLRKSRPNGPLGKGENMTDTPRTDAEEFALWKAARDERIRTSGKFVLTEEGRKQARKIFDEDSWVLPLLDKVEELERENAALLSALKKTYFELNTIHARDGVPYTSDGWKSDVDQAYFTSVVEEARSVLDAAMEKK